MKRILISQRVVVDPVTSERRDALDQRWWPFLAAVGVLATPVPNHLETAKMLLYQSKWDGVLLTGGNDLGAYGGDAPERDAVEQLLLNSFLGPIAGVCRGMQHLVVHAGGSLHPVAGHISARHGILERTGEREVNSYHGWGIASLPTTLRPIAHSDDGTVEAIASTERPWSGILWHPEREPRAAVEDIAWLRSVWGIE